MSTESELAKSFNTDVVERHAKAFTSLLARHVAWPAQTVRALDLACGTGYGTVPLLRRLPTGSVVVAISDDRFALKELHKSLDAELRRLIYPRKENPARLPFAPNVFDLVWGAYPTGVPAGAEAVFRRALRVLRPGGQLALAVPLQGSFLELVQTLGVRDPDAMRRVIADTPELESGERWQQVLTATGAEDVAFDRTTITLIATPPLSKDRLLARHVLPIWLGEGPSDATDALLDRCFVERLEVTVQIGCIRARRGAAEIEEVP